MKVVGVKEVKQKLSRYLDGLERDLVIITKKGRPYAGMVRLTNESDLETFLTANNPRLMALIDGADQQGGATPLESIEALVRKTEARERREEKRAASKAISIPCQSMHE